MDEFESLLEKERSSVERYVRFKLNDPTEADDVLQDIYLTAFQKFSSLRKDLTSTVIVCNTKIIYLKYCHTTV